MTRQKLKSEIRLAYGSKCQHIGSRPIIERVGMNGKIIWKGTVEVFKLLDNTKAERAFAWEDPDDPEKVVTVLERPPVDSPRSAVRFSIAEKRRHRKNTVENRANPV
jgi:hypothetical protein